MINFNFSNNNKPENGSLLISEPFIADDHFSRSVIYLCDHNDKGSFGFVLNKYIDVAINDIIPEVDEKLIKVSIGGPVDKNNLFYIHRLNERIPDGQLIKDNVYIGGKFSEVNTLITSEPEQIKDIRFFIGYSGWSPGQLEQEIKENSWIVINGDNSDIVFNTSIEKLWKSLLKDQGGRFELMADFPINPSDN